MVLRTLQQNELDAARASVQNEVSMKSPDRFLKSRGCYAAVLGIASAICLSACEEKEAETSTPAEQPAPAVEEQSAPVAVQPAPEVKEQTSSRDALFDYAVYTLAQKVTNPERYPELNSTVKDMLEMLRSYYEELKQGEPGMERSRLALLIADTTRNLGAFSKAYGEYEAAQKEVDGLPADIQGSTEAQRMLSSCLNGMGVCLLAQNKASEALLKYEAALAVDEAQYQAVAPKDGEELPEGEVEPKLSRAATDLLDSYRCLGDCQRAVDDPEEARTTYAKGQALAQRLKRLSSDMSISYVKLLTALGNLDNSLGKPGDAMNSWLVAARICQSLNANSPKLEVKAETKRCFDSLLPVIQTVGQKLQAEQQEAQKKQEDTQREEAEKAAREAEEAAAAEKAAAERLEAERKAAEEKAAAEQEAANKRVRNRRRH